MPLYRFGDFDFNQPGFTLGEYQDNFTDLQTQVVSLPGMTGGFDLYGADANVPNAVGKITQEVTIRSMTREAMDGKRDALKAIASQGKKMLVMRPTNYPAQPQRYCYARIARIPIVKDEGEHTDLLQRAMIEWQVSDPRWLVELSTGMMWGEEWGGVWNEAQVIVAASGVLTEEIVAYGGNLPYEARVIFETDGLQTAEWPTIQRVVDGIVVEQVQYQAVITDGQSLSIDALRHTVKLDGTDAYNNFFVTRTESWLTLAPGNNLLRIQFANSGDAATVQIYYKEANR